MITQDWENIETEKSYQRRGTVAKKALAKLIKRDDGGELALSLFIRNNLETLARNGNGNLFETIKIRDRKAKKFERNISTLKN
jgi:hypothetical protein